MILVLMIKDFEDLEVETLWAEGLPLDINLLPLPQISSSPNYRRLDTLAFQMELVISEDSHRASKSLLVPPASTIQELRPSTLILHF